MALGALNVDLIQAGESGSVQEEVRDSETLATPAEIWDQIRARNLSYEAFLGGSAFLTITLMAQLQRPGVRLGMIGVSADAPTGPTETHRARLARLHIDDLTARSSGVPGLCGAWPSPSGRILRTTPLANLEIVSHLKKAEIVAAAAGADILHATSLLEDPYAAGPTPVADSVAEFIRRVRAASPGILISFDPGDTWVVLKDTAAIRYLLREANLLFLNDEECEKLTGAHGDAASELRSLHELCPNGTMIVRKYVDRVLVQRSTEEDSVCVPKPAATTVIDPTGAGDALAAGVLTALAEGRGIAQGCDLGMRIAQHRIADYGDRGLTDLLAQLGSVWE